MKDDGEEQHEKEEEDTREIIKYLLSRIINCNGMTCLLTVKRLIRGGTLPSSSHLLFLRRSFFATL